MTKPTLNSTGSRTNWLFPILCLFTVTFFVYRDFDIRMLYGFAALCLVLGIHCLRRLILDHPPALDPLRLALLLLAAVVLLNFLRPDSRHDADSVSFILSMFICASFVILSRPSKKTAQIAMGLCFAGALFVCAFVHFFQANPWYFWNWLLMKLSSTAGSYLCYYIPRGYGFSLGGCTQTDYTLFLGLAVCCGYLVSSRKFSWKSAVAMAFGGLFFYSILIVGRRGELLGATVCLGLLVLALCSKKQRRWLILGSIAAIVVGFGLIVLLLPWLKQFPSLYRYVRTVEQILKGQDFTSGRLELYALAWDSFLKNPLFGLGWDNFYSVIPESFQELHGQNIVEDVHNIYLQFLAEAGLVGTPFLVAPMFYAYWLVCRQFSRLKGCSTDLLSARMFCTVSFMIQSFLLVMGLLDPTFQKVVFWCFYCIALLLQCTALELEGHTPDDPVSRFLARVIHFCAPPFVLIWNWVAGLFRPLRR